MYVKRKIKKGVYKDGSLPIRKPPVLKSVQSLLAHCAP